MRRPPFPLIGLIVFGCAVMGFAALGGDNNLPEPNISRTPFQPSAVKHETRVGPQGVLEFPNVNANAVTSRIETVSPAPTRSSLMATGGSVDDAKGYLLDVSTSNSFSSYVTGYHDLDVGNINGRAVIGLNPGTTYYYRVCPYTAAGFRGDQPRGSLCRNCRDI